MKKVVLIILLILIILIIVVVVAVLLFFPELENNFPKRVSNQNISGMQIRSQVWSGEILITGDTSIIHDLTILPGTKIKFVVGDDQEKGAEHPPDGFLDLDPTRLLSYAKTHSSLTIFGKLEARGTPENKILFTSAASQPKFADWEAILTAGDGNIIEYAIIEYSRNGISSGALTPNSIYRNNIIRYTLWGPIATTAHVINNEIYECGHQAINVGGGNPVIENNTIHDCNFGIVIAGGSPIVKNNNITNSGSGISVDETEGATPILENNYVKLADPDSKKEWRYGDFAYRMYEIPPAGTPLFLEVYKENNLARYTVPAYKIAEQNYTINLPFEAEWLIYGGRNNWFQKIEFKVLSGEYKLPSGYSLYALIPNPTSAEKIEATFNKLHKDIYRW